MGQTSEILDHRYEKAKFLDQTLGMVGNRYQNVKSWKIFKNLNNFFQDNICIESLQHLENFQVNFFKFSKSKISKQHKAQIAYRIFENRQKFFSWKIPRFARDFHSYVLNHSRGGRNFSSRFALEKLRPNSTFPYIMALALWAFNNYIYYTFNKYNK